MRKFFPLFITLIFTFISSVSAGDFAINNGKTEVKFNTGSNQQLSFSSRISSLSFLNIITPEGSFTQLSVDGYGHSNSIGNPALPEYGRLIEVPIQAEFEILITRQEFREYTFSQIGIEFPIMPAQESVSKNADPNHIPFQVNKNTYLSDQWLGNDLVSVSPVGIMRSVRLARIDISAVQYNPVLKKLRIYDNIEVTIVFRHADQLATRRMKQQYTSIYFNNLYHQLPNYTPPVDSIITDSPVTYVIVSPPMFRDSLQRFIRWKIQKGYHVIQAYTDNPAVGNTATSIKAYLADLYQNPPAGYEPHTFVLIVGDVAQIPPSSNSGQPTDLRYCEYTGDNIPEAFYGRFSATNATHLKAYIDKTLEYEQYAFPDDSFLNEVVMVSGYDAGGNGMTYGNGQINYGTNYYFNAAHGLLSHTYLQPEPSGANYSMELRGNISDGVAYANYTAHGSVSGWSDPSFTIANIPALQNEHKYSLMVGNCCVTSTYTQTCFAEEITRTPKKGALGYIGASNNSYWDEDYWWGVGYKNVSTNPPYNATKLGAYDVTFHDHGEPTAKWYLTMGQMIVGGNMAVEQSNSSMKKYYWEIYNLMGDPSLMVYYAVPPALTATYPEMVAEGVTDISVMTEPWAYVALSISDTVLLDAQCADSSGMVNLSFDPVTGVEGISISICKQNRRPILDSIMVEPFTVIASISPDNICQHDTAFLSAMVSGGSGSYTYLWSPSTYLNDPSLPNPISVPEENIAYTLTVDDGFHSVTSLPKSIGVGLRPQAPVITLQGDSLVSNISEGNQWYRYGEPIPFANGASFTPTISGDYYDIIIDTNYSCSSLPSNTIPYYFSHAENLNAKEDVMIYPNPVRNEFTVSYTLVKTSPVRISLMDQMGKEILVLTDLGNQLAGKYEVRVNCNDLIPGFYFCKILTDSNNLVKKILVLQ